MDVRLIEAKAEDKEILRNLLEKYEYEFSQWTGVDVNRLGLYGYNYLDCYWTDPNRWAFFIMVDDRLAGFAMVNDYPEVPGEPLDWVLSEFFVLYKYRRMGVGRTAAAWLFHRFPGRWQLMRHPKNLASVRFWDSVVDECARGQYRVVPGAEYEDGTPGEVLLFDNSTAKEHPHE